MKDIDRVNILDGLVFEIVFGKVEKSGVEKPSYCILIHFGAHSWHSLFIDTCLIFTV